MNKCPIFEIECTYWTIFGDGTELLCVGSNDQCWHWRHPKPGVDRGLKKPKLPDSTLGKEPEPKARSIELEDEE